MFKQILLYVYNVGITCWVFCDPLPQTPPFSPEYQVNKPISISCAAIVLVSRLHLLFIYFFVLSFSERNIMLCID